MKKLIIYLLLIIFVVLFIFAVFSRPALTPIEKTFISFDTFVHITLYPAEGTLEVDPFPHVQRELERIQQRFGYGEQGLPAMLNDQRKRVCLSKEDRYLIERAMEITQQTDGGFDITVGALEALWGFKDELPHLPQEKEIALALRSVGRQHMAIRDSSIFLDKGCIIDLGGISKGHAVDRVVHILKKSGIPAGVVDAGGDLRVFGKKPDGKKWTIAIKHPLKQEGLLGSFELDSGAVATSGNYERSFMEKGTRYHHIIDPRTGYPADRCVSVTVLAPDALTADALATGIFVLGPESGMELAESIPGVEAAIVFLKNGTMEMLTSRGFCLK